MSGVGAFDLIRMSNREIDRLIAHVKRCEDWFTDQLEGKEVSDLWPQVVEEEISDGYAAFHLNHLFETPEDGIDEEYDEDEEDDEEDEIPEEPLDDRPITAEGQADESMDGCDDAYDDLSDMDDEEGMELDEDEAKRIYLAMQGLGPAAAAGTSKPSATMTREAVGTSDRLLAQSDQRTSLYASASGDAITVPTSLTEVPAAPILHDHSYLGETEKTTTSPTPMPKPMASSVRQTREPVIKTIYMTEDQMKKCTSGKRYVLVLNYPNRKTGNKVNSMTSIYREVPSGQPYIIPPTRVSRFGMESGSGTVNLERSTACPPIVRERGKYCPRAVVKPTIHPVVLPHCPVTENKILACTSKTYSRITTPAKTIICSPPSEHPAPLPPSPQTDPHLMPPSPDTCHSVTTIIID